MRLISEMSFDECLAELQGIHCSIKLNGGSATKGILMRKAILAEGLVKMDWKKFFEIFQDQFDEFSNLIIRKAVNESPIFLFELLMKSPGNLSMTLSLISEVNPQNLQNKQLDVIVKCIQNGIKFSYFDNWDELFELLEKHRPESIETLLPICLDDLSAVNTMKTEKKIETIKRYQSSYQAVLSRTSLKRLDHFLEALHNQLDKELHAKISSFDQQVMVNFEKGLINLREFVDAVTDEYIEKHKTEDLLNREELLSFDSKFTDDLYHSLDKGQILIAHGDDELQYESNPFYVLEAIQDMLYNLSEYYESSDLEIDFKTLHSKLKASGLKSFAKFLNSYAPEDSTFASDWLSIISDVESQYWEGGYDGICHYYFIDESEYSKRVNELKQICLTVANWAEKNVNI